MSMIQVKNLTFTYDGSYEPVFENASFQIDTGRYCHFCRFGFIFGYIMKVI